jgi:hypothetical protein
MAVSAAQEGLLKRAAIALSIANLCFLYVWGEVLLLASDRRMAYFLQRAPEPSLLWALITDVVLLAAGIFALLTLREVLRGRRRWAVSAIAALITAFGLYQLQRSFNGWLYGVISPVAILWIRLLAATALLVFVARWPRRAAPALRACLLIMAPLFFVYAAQGLWLYYGPPARRLVRGDATARLFKGGQRQRIIWIIFDELDGRLLFDARPRRIQLPEFDRLRSETLSADRVKSPAHNTLSAIPSLLLSKTVPADEDVDLKAALVRVRFSGCQQFVRLTSQPNIFQRVRALGLNTAVAGWYHPYCRLFGGDLNACVTENGLMDAAGIHEYLRSRSFLQKAVYLANWQARSFPLNDRYYWIRTIPQQGRLNRELHIARVVALENEMMPLLENRQLNFVFLHLPVPHPLGIWDPQSSRFTTDREANYADNLALADRILGQIRAKLEQTGDWNRSTILVSADHPYRTEHWLTSKEIPPSPEMLRLTHDRWQPYIPFLLKLPGQTTGVAYHREFNSVLSADLLMAALEGSVETPEEAVHWLDAHAEASEEKVCR